MTSPRPYRCWRRCEERGQRPDELVADTAFGSGDNAVNAERLGTELVRPVKGPQGDVEERPDTVTKADFLVEAGLRDPAICPAGYLAREQTPCEKKSHHVALTFEREACETCALLSVCPVKWHRDRDGYALTVDLNAVNLERRRRALARGAFGERYRIRAGIEATVSELKRRHGMGSLRARGAGRLPQSAGLQYQENGAGAGAQTRSLGPGEGLKKGMEVPFGPEKRPQSLDSVGRADRALRTLHRSPFPTRFIGRQLSFRCKFLPGESGFIRENQDLSREGRVLLCRTIWC